MQSRLRLFSEDAIYHRIDKSQLARARRRRLNVIRAVVAFVRPSHILNGDIVRNAGGASWLSPAIARIKPGLITSCYFLTGWNIYGDWTGIDNCGIATPVGAGLQRYRVENVLAQNAQTIPETQVEVRRPPTCVHL